ncbi:hypothetical protein GCM10010348_60250 [Streptomyces anthocyanicus]|uniref:Uncharacterized protein n=2 Tax=Streptomyces violaceoruber group TaxID=2867121 RepID=A0ACD4WTM6_STRVN|nr:MULTISPECIES: hypothetical protein [Streptomyces]WOZ00861.1 hypothetical protein R2E43_26815 [Streptomyces violaceoruber]BDD71840.1 hypothetical protein JCM4020_24600 [Streptomyces coelicolor]PSK55544.1 hypothetical protein B0E38_03149 [Streptomyces sp. 111WW2]REH20674.1 hypothetical protein BX268_2461 [Streptomyces sp. 2221.1]SDT32021.1 hypothetical protein SAMN05428941_2456 [Streptomyces sp. 2114.2]
MRATGPAAFPYRLARHELRLWASLWLWAARRTHDSAAGGAAFGYARGQGAMMFGLAFVCVVESVTMSVLLRDWPAAHHVVLVLDVYTVVMVVGLHAASVVRPHVLDAAAGTLRVRRALHVDVRIPLERIASVRRELRTTHTPADGELDLAVGSQTSVTVELTEPVAHLSFFGRRREVRVVRCHADDPGAFVRAVELAREGHAVP